MNEIKAPQALLCSHSPFTKELCQDLWQDIWNRAFLTFELPYKIASIDHQSLNGTLRGHSNDCTDD